MSMWVFLLWRFPGNLHFSAVTRGEVDVGSLFQEEVGARESR